MATKIITIHVDDEPVEVTLKSARKDDGLWRAELMMKSSEQMDRMRQIAAFHLYPTCVAAVKEPASVRDMSFDDFMAKVDEADIDAWVGAAYELNPQWKQSMKALVDMTEDEKKRPGTSVSGSPVPTET
jgi:hypothetical protein